MAALACAPVRHAVCSICLEEYPIKLCSISCCTRKDECDERFCQKCLEIYCVNHASATFALCKELACPSANCTGIIPLSAWRMKCSEDIAEGYRKRLLSSLSIVCPACHKIGRPFAEYAYVCISSKWNVYRKTFTKVRVQISNENLVKTSGAEESGGSHKDSNPFLEQRELSEQLLQDAKLSTAWKLVSHALETGSYSLEDLVEHFFSMLEGKSGAIETFSSVFLSYVSLQPKIFTNCCKQPVCFRCQCAGHHEGVSCGDALLEIQHEIFSCPRCKAQLTQTDGCPDVCCPLCGLKFESKVESS